MCESDVMYNGQLVDPVESMTPEAIKQSTVDSRPSQPEILRRYLKHAEALGTLMIGEQV